MVQPIPEGYHSITPYLIVSDAAAAIDWYTKALGAKELMRLPGPDGKLMHAELQIGNSRVMLADEMPDWGILSATTIGNSPVSLCLYVEDADTCFHQAIAAGAQQERPLENQFYGDRSAAVKDPFGHTWTIATHIEDLTPEELDKRFQATMCGEQNPSAPQP